MGRTIDLPVTRHRSNYAQDEYMAGGITQDRILGSLMGMAIGDALGMPVSGWSSERIAQRYGRVDDFFPRVLADGGEIKAGEFTEESEIALCIVESFTVNGGELDADNIGTRMLYLARGEAKRWIHPDTLSALNEAKENLHFVRPLDEDGPATGDVAARGIPIGLIHAAGAFDPDQLRADAEMVTRITHGSPAAIAATTAVAHLVRTAARNEIPPEDWATAAARFLGAGAVAEALYPAGRTRKHDGFRTAEDAADVVASAAAIAASTDSLSDAVFDAVNLGGAADARGAIAGAIAGARWGIAGIPQKLIDDLEGRIYISLAAPWFYRVVLRRAGMLLDLRAE
jgi:ADP-ribosyl-[dinitrogen reductase] hydrolase